MGCEHSFRSKAVHFVSDLTTVLLNPISDQPSDHDRHKMEMRISQQSSVSEGDSGVPIDGPDTSSFTAFLVSLLSSDSGSHSNEKHGEHHAEISEPASDPGIKGNVGRKNLITRGKQSLTRAIYRVARVNRSREQSLEQRVDFKNKNDDKSDSGLEAHELGPLLAQKEISKPVRLPDMSEPSLLLSENTQKGLYISMPALVQGRKWVLLYSTWRHGISLSTLYRRSALCPGYCLLVVGDQKGAVFGGLIEAPLRPTTKRKYQGTNNTFVFTNVSSSPVIYRPTGANRYFTLCSTDYLAMGGGGHFALYLDGDLLNGSSSASDTYGNSCLAHSQEFDVKEVELWGFAYSSKYDETVALCRTEAPGICRW